MCMCMLMNKTVIDMSIYRYAFLVMVVKHQRLHNIIIGCLEMVVMHARMQRKRMMNLFWVGPRAGTGRSYGIVYVCGVNMVDEL